MLITHYLCYFLTVSFTYIEKEYSKEYSTPAPRMHLATTIPPMCAEAFGIAVGGPGEWSSVSTSCHLLSLIHSPDSLILSMATMSLLR
jgi:hypothetical protein